MSVSPFFRVIEFTVEPDTRNITRRKARRATSPLVLPSDEAQLDLKFSDIIRIGILHRVYAFKALL